MGFDYRTAVDEDILRLARGLKGMRLGQIKGSVFSAATAVSGKGEAGLAVEAFFGIPPNARPEADFPGAGIELKIVPIVRRGRNFKVKERTVLGMIDYRKLILETWETAKVRKKLRILFVFVEHLIDTPKADFPIRAVALWEPKGLTLELIRLDWEKVKWKVIQGLAHELSESDGRLMGPCTKGADSTRRVAQPVTTLSPTAKPRAFALKPSLTKTIFHAETTPKTDEESLIENLEIDDVDRFEEAILVRYSGFLGRTVGEVAQELGVSVAGAKSGAAGIVRQALGATSPKSSIAEFDTMGITIRTVRVAPDLLPYESTSFPAFRHMELIEEEWADSTLLAQVDGIFFFPLVGERKETPQDHCRLGSPFLWRPTVEELAIIEEEWTLFRDQVRAGRADALPTAKTTRIIHVRPHARDSTDTEEAPGVGSVVKKSFWLNRHYVHELLRKRAA